MRESPRFVLGASVEVRDGLFEGGVYVADEVADVAAAVEEGYHGLLGACFGGFG